MLTKSIIYLKNQIHKVNLSILIDFQTKAIIYKKKRNKYLRKIKYKTKNNNSQEQLQKSIKIKNIYHRHLRNNALMILITKYFKKT